MRGNLIQFADALKIADKLFPFIFSYGSDKNQIDYAKNLARKKYIQFHSNSVCLEIDLHNQKKPMDSISKTISKSHDFFTQHFFVCLQSLPEKQIPDLLNLSLSHTKCSFFVDLSHIPLFYKGISKYDLNPAHYFVASYPFKPAEKENFITSYLNSYDISIKLQDKKSIIDTFSDDFSELRQQVEKISLYVDDSKIIALQDAHHLLNSKELGHIDSLFLSMLLGKKKAFDAILDLAQSAQFDPHFVARSFLKYLKKIFYVTTNQIETIPASFEGLSPYVLKLLIPSIRTLQSKYSKEILFSMLQRTNKMEEELRVTQKDPIQTLNQFLFQINALYIASSVS